MSKVKSFFSNGGGQIENAVSYSDLVCAGTGAGGGIIGRTGGDIVLKNCSFYGSAIGYRSGGIIGYNDTSSSIINCIAVGKVLGQCQGGMVGFHNSGSENIKMSFWDKNISGCTRTVGNIEGNKEGKTTAELQDISTYDTGTWTASGYVNVYYSEDWYDWVCEWVSGDKFPYMDTYMGVYYYIYIDGVQYRVFQYISDTKLLTSCNQEKTNVQYTYDWIAPWDISDYSETETTIWKIDEGYTYPHLAIEPYNKFEGTTKLNNNILSGAKIYLFDTTTNELKDTVISDVDGKYQLRTWDNDVYHIFGEYDSGTKKYNAKSYPFITGEQ